MEPSSKDTTSYPNLSPGPIALLVRAALRDLGLLIKTIASGQAVSDSLFDARNLLPSLENELTRFKMWAGNLGAHQAGPASLDYRLREASHLQEQVVYLLRDACESLQDVLTTIELGNTVRDIKGKQLAHDRRDDASEESFTDSDADETALETSLPTLCTDLQEVVDCLLRLSVAIANPAPHERFRKFGADDISYREPSDIAYVRDKFPLLVPEVAENLGKAITRRRQFFRYRMARHEKLAAGLEGIGEGGDGQTDIFPQTVASTLPEHIKNLSNLDLRNGVIDEDSRSDTAGSMTSYATSAGSFLAGDTTNPPPPLRVPPLPKEAESGSFECAYCYRIISARTRAAWKRHVFGDLRPYTCFLDKCLESNADFERRGLWQAHMSQHHWRTWPCPFQCDGKQHPSAADLTVHIRKRHLEDASTEQLDAMVRLGEAPASEATGMKCPICQHPTVGVTQYTRHVGRHLEQLALFALPYLDRDYAEDSSGNEENQTGSDASSGSAPGPEQLEVVEAYAASKQSSDDISLGDVPGTIGPTEWEQLFASTDSIIKAAKDQNWLDEPDPRTDIPLSSRKRMLQEEALAESLEDNLQAEQASTTSELTDMEPFLAETGSDIMDEAAKDQNGSDSSDPRTDIPFSSQKQHPQLVDLTTIADGAYDAGLADARVDEETRGKISRAEIERIADEVMTTRDKMEGITDRMTEVTPPWHPPPRPTVPGNEPPAGASPDRNTPPASKRREQILSDALNEANKAVQFDNDGEVDPALEKYTATCSHIREVLEQTTEEEDRAKLSVILETYEGRIRELSNQPGGSANEEGSPSSRRKVADN